MPAMTAPRMSVKVEAVADSVILKLVGLLTFAGSGYFLFLEFKTPPTHTSHIALFLGTALFGLALAFTKPVVNTAQSILVVIGPYIPGHHAGDDK